MIFILCNIFFKERKKGVEKKENERKEKEKEKEKNAATAADTMASHKE